MKTNFDFRRKILIALFIALPFILFNSCEHLLDSPSIPNEKTTVGGTLSAPTGLKASQGLKRKISLSWNAVDGAKYYNVYFSESDTTEFTKIGEPKTNSFDDANISAGRTLYFKVCAVKSDGTQSSFSSLVKGTSLAEPIISSGEVTDSSATISWFMENARSIDGQDNYEDLLKFDVVCEPKSGNGGKIETIAAKEFLNSSYEYTFEKLSGAQDYQFYVKAYLETDQQSFEQSRTVDKTTLTSYMPLAPEFNATRGESTTGITLLIKLPEMVMVNTETPTSQNEKIDEPYPLYFKIFRKHANDENYNFEKPVAILYYNGNVGKNGELGEAAAPSVSDYKETAYKPGSEIKWLDDSADLIGGEKYDYMIRSYVDANYSKVLWPEEEDVSKRYTNMNYGTDPAKATEAMGWKSAHPIFEVNRSRFENNGKEFSEDGAKVLSVKFGFKAEWKDLGKAGEYKFAIKQSYKPFGAGDGKDIWLENNTFFATLDDINSYVIEFGSKEKGLSESEKGAYSYTLYVVAKTAEIGDIEDGSDKVLDAVKAMDEIIVSDDVNLPTAELAVQGGFKDKVLLTISSLEKGVKYEVARTIMENGVPKPDGILNLDEIVVNDDNAGNAYAYQDTSVKGNCSYSYVLKAVAESGAYDQSASQSAETLGTPEVEFVTTSLSYDSITVSFKGVLAARKYEIKIGNGGDFGNGDTFRFNVDDLKSGASGSVSSVSVNAVSPTSLAMAEISLTDKYTVKINKPYGYDDANLAGKPADVIVTACSDVDNAPSEPKAVNVIGPALLEAKVVEGGENSISISWNKIEGANGYLIRRVMYDDVKMTEVAEDSECTYYYDSKNKTLSVIEGGSIAGRAQVADGENTFALTDTYQEASDSTEAYERTQAKISWGLPFRYVVLPISDDKGDFTFGTGKKALELAASKVAYKNIKKTDGVATWGYGLNLVADKATSGNTQNLAWEKPHADIAGETAYAATKPVVYRRTAGGSGAFDLFSDNIQDIKDKDAAIKLNKDFCSAFEYLVKYYPDGATLGSTALPPDSLLKDIADKKTEYDTPNGKMTEQDNKGYLLAIEGFTATPDKTAYYERLSWNLWNYNARAVGPDSMTILIQNNNISADAQEALTIEEANTNKTIDVIGSDITAEKLGTSSLRIKPAGIVDGKGAAAADGLLKVLRDYKHNYTFKLTRKGVGNDGEDLTIANTDYEDVKTAWREITDEELVRAATLAMSVGMEKSLPKSRWDRTGSPSETYSPTTQGSLGDVYTKWNSMSYDIHKITFNSCIMDMKAKSGNIVVSFLKLDGSITGRLDSNFARSIPPDSYSGTITITNVIDNETSTLKFDAARRDSTDKLILTHNGIDKKFGNITPLPYHDHNNNEFFNDSEEWQ